MTTTDRPATAVPPARVRPVTVRLSGDEDAVQVAAELLARLAELDGRCQTGEPSRPYPNRRDPGARVYLDLYVLQDQEASDPMTDTSPPDGQRD